MGPWLFGKNAKDSSTFSLQDMEPSTEVRHRWSSSGSGTACCSQYLIPGKRVPEEGGGLTE